MKSDWRGVPRHEDGTPHYSYASKCPYPFVRRKMTNAACAHYRDEICTHQSTMYMGKIPCTGRYVCLMCGASMMEAMDLQEVKRCLLTGMREMFEEMRNE